MSISCTVIRQLRFKPEDTDYMKHCREKWEYSDLPDTISIKLLLLSKKGRYDLMHWPNFYIGICSSGDTIGVIDNFSTQIYKRGDDLIFAPYNYGTDLDKEMNMLYPVFTVYPKDKDNELHCKIRIVYFAKLIE